VSVDQAAQVVYLLLVAAGGGGFMALILTLRPQRRRINAGASSDEANAASVLSGAALDMVREARSEAEAARRETAEVRGLLTAERESHDQTRRDARALSRKVDDLERHVDRLTRLISAAGIDLPPNLDPRQGGHFDKETP
jgi:predicted RNase H-like nuclease (RuvC/YqgF family)